LRDMNMTGGTKKKQWEFNFILFILY
jgi:hypothetical protein